jgi:hypothetical protein
MTAAMWAASRNENARQELHFAYWARLGTVNAGPQAIEAFFAAGGNFTDQQDNLGRTAAMFAIENTLQPLRPSGKQAVTSPITSLPQVGPPKRWLPASDLRRSPPSPLQEAS